jgi:hypothetical protein
VCICVYKLSNIRSLTNNELGRLRESCHGIILTTIPVFFLSKALIAVVIKSTVFYDIKKYSPLKVNRFRRRISPPSWFCLSPSFTLFSCSTYSSTMKMEHVSSATSDVLCCGVLCESVEFVGE